MVAHRGALQGLPTSLRSFLTAWHTPTPHLHLGIILARLVHHHSSLLPWHHGT